MSRVFVVGDQENRTVTITGLTRDEKATIPLWLSELPAHNRVGRITLVEPSEVSGIVVTFSKESTACMMAELVRNCLVENGLNRSKGLAMTHFTRDY